MPVRLALVGGAACVLLACAREPGPTGGVTTDDAKPAGGAPLSGVGIGAGAAVPSACGFALPPDVPTCADDVTEGADCDGTVAACVDERTPPVRHACMNLANGKLLGWTEIRAVQTACDERADACGDSSPPDPQAFVDEGVRATLGACLGNESWVNVLLADGCVTDFTLSSTRPDEVDCILDALGSLRFGCAPDVTCSGALISTLR